MSTKPVLAITMGDPAGIGPEIIVKALARPDVRRLCRPVIIGSPEELTTTASRLKVAVKFHKTANVDIQSSPGVISVIDPLARPLKSFTAGRVSLETGEAQARYIHEAVRLAGSGTVAGIVTAPINKEAINLAGHPYPGHTEMLAALTGTKEVGMMIVGGPLRIMFTTTHVAMKDLPQRLTPDLVARAIRLCHQGLRDLFRIKRPRVAVAALNPHGGEGGLFGTEERDTIVPGIMQAEAAGCHAQGPFPADTLMGQAATGNFDAVVAMYHDQGLIPLKLIAFGRAVNITIGLPIIRTSVDHGTAYDIAGKGVADPGSLVAAIELAAKFASHRP
jgi:4-hydroxythreonine-4-phosphate dehydrogenase